MICRAKGSRDRFLELASQPTPYGTTLAISCCDEQAFLEPGTPANHVWIRAFVDQEFVEAAFTELDRSELAQSGQLQTLVAPAISVADGLTLEVPVTTQNAYCLREPELMVIDGSVSDETAIASYRDIIMPLLGDAGAHYLVYCGADAVSVRHGEWSEQFLAVSRWPGERAARQFWQGREYQSEAIPTRTGAGSFGVTLFRASGSQAWHSAAAKQLVRRMLTGLWTGDKELAKSTIAADAEWWFLPSLDYPRPMHPDQAIDIVMDDMIGRFDASKPFEVTLHRLIAEGSEVTVEYTAVGTTINGLVYDHRYCLRATVVDDKIKTVRPWADTRYFLDTLYGDAP